LIHFYKREIIGLHLVSQQITAKNYTRIENSPLPMMKGSGDRVCCTFTTYNVLGTLFGALVVGVAGWLAADKISFFTQLQLHQLKDDQVGAEFGNISVIDYGAYILVAVGVAIVIQSLLGCTGTFLGCCGSRKARCCLITYSVLVAIVILLEIVGAVLVLHVYQGHVKKETETFLLETINEDYRTSSQGEPNGVTVLWDHIMASLMCCGVNSYLDFQRDPAVYEVPRVCCQSAGSNLTEPSCPGQGEAPTTQMTTGCYSVLLTHSVPAIAASLAVVALFQIAGVILACCLSRKVDDKREWYELTDM